jgi:hypothetical protein
VGYELSERKDCFELVCCKTTTRVEDHGRNGPYITNPYLRDSSFAFLQLTCRIFESFILTFVSFVCVFSLSIAGDLFVTSDMATIILKSHRTRNKSNNISAKYIRVGNFRFCVFSKAWEKTIPNNLFNLYIQ